MTFQPDPHLSHSRTNDRPALHSPTYSESSSTLGHPQTAWHGGSRHWHCWVDLFYEPDLRPAIFQQVMCSLNLHMPLQIVKIAGFHPQQIIKMLIQKESMPATTAHPASSRQNFPFLTYAHKGKPAPPMMQISQDSINPISGNSPESVTFRQGSHRHGSDTDISYLHVWPLAREIGIRVLFYLEYFSGAPCKLSKHNQRCRLHREILQSFPLPYPLTSVMKLLYNHQGIVKRIQRGQATGILSAGKSGIDLGQRKAEKHHCERTIRAYHNETGLQLQ